ncbi:hypothetical protein ACEPAH_699 [Sanghuangporus vaninii]
MSSLHSRSSTKPSSIPLYRRLLFPDLPPTAAVPPILPQASVQLNTELYDLIALALRAYITPWWSKITRYDNEFVPQVACVVGTVIRELAARFEKADVEGLLLRAVPVVVAQHYSDYRTAAAKVGSAYANGGTATLPQLFHQHQSHMAIDAEGNVDPIYIRHLIDLILHECLPAEDQESDAERAIIREVIVKVVMQDAIPLLSQPWFIYKLMLDQLASGHETSSTPLKANEVPQTRPSSPSSHNMVVFALSMVQYLSGLCLRLIHWYKQLVNVVKRVNTFPQLAKPDQRREFTQSLLSCSSVIMNARSRMASSVLFDVMEYSLKLVEDFSDRFLVYMLHTYVMTEEQLITIVKLTKQTLFPNGYPGPPLVLPTPEEQVVIKERLIREIETCAPPLLSGLALGPGSSKHESIAEALEPLSSTACNVHLVLFLLDLIVLTLFPEFGAAGSAEDAAVVSAEGREGSSKMISSASPSPSPSPSPEPDNVRVETSAADLEMTKQRKWKTVTLRS